MGGRKERLDAQLNTCVEQFNHSLLLAYSIFLNISTEQEKKSLGTRLANELLQRIVRS